MCLSIIAPRRNKIIKKITQLKIIIYYNGFGFSYVLACVCVCGSRKHLAQQPVLGTIYSVTRIFFVPTFFVLLLLLFITIPHVSFLRDSRKKLLPFLLVQFNGLFRQEIIKRLDQFFKTLMTIISPSARMHIRRIIGVCIIIGIQLKRDARYIFFFIHLDQRAA